MRVIIIIIFFNWPLAELRSWPSNPPVAASCVLRMCYLSLPLSSVTVDNSSFCASIIPCAFIIYSFACEGWESVTVLYFCGA